MTSLKKSKLKYNFASDNTSGLCPEAWEAMASANDGYESSYGDDQYTAEACELFRKLFEVDCDVYFVLTGTAANSLSLASLCESYHSVIVHEKSHIETDECGAPEFFSNGTKILLAPGETGKLDSAQVEKIVTKRTDIHYPKPRVVSVSQSTELGTVYKLDELRAIHEVSKKYGLKIHMDGARFANALVHLNAKPADITWKVGVDVLCLGGIKLGASLSEAIIFFNRELSSEFAFRCKQAGQLAPKMRMFTAPWVSMLKND
jgi:threonine aldolase